MKNLSVAVLDFKELLLKGFIPGLPGISIDLDTVRLDNYYCDILVLLYFVHGEKPFCGSS